MRYKFLLLVIFSIFIISNQVFSKEILLGEESIDSKYVKSDYKVSKSKYSGTYHFGYSEGEYYYRVITSGRKVFLQKVYHDLVIVNDKDMWKRIVVNVKGSYFSKNFLYANGFKAKFVKYYEKKKTFNGLLLMKADGKKIELEIGTKVRSLKKEFPGKYPEGSYKKLTRSMLASKSKLELQIMRNEIYARYGYIFKKGGKMEKYFKSQKWYYPQHKNIDSFLSPLEKKNISFLYIVGRKK